MAAKAATATIPIVLVSGDDPARLGLVPSLSRPGGNMTGVTFTTAGLMSKKLSFLRQLVPEATIIGYLAEDGRTYAAGSPISRATRWRLSSPRSETTTTTAWPSRPSSGTASPRW
jgi:ABC transporter substrate binding protein